ncbi:MAG: LysR family transcriptional regulator [Rubrobacteraceae bacterium]|uniref:LysR family transcriptional regulator n=1 Tax=Rubrobacter naiadicus TaxID=1392641 RepID=UPI002360E3DD|nr:LysR family transcriptional regulator [Rubrobacter naiadicus]MBX6764320.1 LysR family transcriptional regulator [Rubrobacteraceae bacterium]
MIAVSYQKRDMELRQLRYFVTIAEELHFRRAAERLHMSQPPLSQQIQKLERELGVELFRRANRRIELTDAGRIFLREARQTLMHAERSVEVVKYAARGEIGWLRIGFVGSVSYELLPYLLQEYRQRYPAVQLKLRQLTTEEQIEALETDEIDVGISRELREEGEFAVQPLLRERLVAALPITHTLAERRELALSELAEDPFIVLPRPEVPRLYDHIIHLCRAAGFTPRVAQEALQFPAILGLVSAGLGVAVVPAMAKAFRKTGVVCVVLSDDNAISEVVIAYRPDREPPTLPAFLDVSRHAVAKWRREGGSNGELYGQADSK